MTLVVFDLDGTLLDNTSKISGYTADTLALMRAKRIPYTVATGRTLQAAFVLGMPPSEGPLPTARAATATAPSTRAATLPAMRARVR